MGQLMRRSLSCPLPQISKGPLPLSPIDRTTVSLSPAFLLRSAPVFADFVCACFYRERKVVSGNCQLSIDLFSGKIIQAFRIYRPSHKWTRNRLRTRSPFAVQRSRRSRATLAANDACGERFIYWFVPWKRELGD